MSDSLLDIQELELEVLSTGEKVLHGMSAQVKAGEITAVVGESGSGKTLTTLAAIGLLPPMIRLSSGSIRLEGDDCSDLSARQWREIRGCRVAMVFQEPMTALDPVFTIGELFEGIMALDGMRRREARLHGQALLEEVRVPDPRRCLSSVPHQLSGGMRQRVVLALALARSPAVLLADEPTTALDALTQEAVMDLLQELCERRGLGVLLVTHDLGLVARRVHQLVVLHEGRVCESGAASRLLEDPRHPYTRGLLACRLPVGSFRHRLGRMEDILADPGSWEPQESQEGLVRPWRPVEDCQALTPPRLVPISADHFLAV